MPSIRELLESKNIKIVRTSEVGDKINNFDKDWESEQLFSFLINNQLNRYLFNVFIRIGNLDIDNWPFNTELLAPSKIKEKVKESFIKKISCSTCENVLYNEAYIDLAKLEEIGEITCPNCKLVLELNYDRLEDSFEISKEILHEFLEQLVTRSIFKSRYIKYCLKCRNKKVIEDINKLDSENLKCDKCKKHCNISQDYFVDNKFLKECLIKRGGDWFEWYVYKLCSYMHEEVEHNLIIEITEGDTKKELEIDIIGRDGDKLFVYECKDTQKVSNWKDFENLPDLVNIFENVIIVNSYDSDRNAIKKIIEPYKKEVKILKGSDLEDNFMGVDPTLIRLKSEEWPYSRKGVESFKRLPQNKEVEIIDDLLESIKDDKEINENLLAFNKIADGVYNFEGLLLKKERILRQEALNFLLNKLKPEIISDKTLLFNIIEFIRIMLDTEAGYVALLKEMDSKNWFIFMQPYLKNQFEDPINLATHNFYTSLFFKSKEMGSNLSSEEISTFFDEFLPTLDKYGSWRRQVDTLRVIKEIVKYLDESRVDKLLTSLKTNVSTFSWSVNEEIADICEMIYNRNKESKEKVKEILVSMSEVKEDTSSTTGKSYLKKLNLI